MALTVSDHGFHNVRSWPWLRQTLAFQCVHGLHDVRPWPSHCQIMAFTLSDHGLQDVRSWLSQCKTMSFKMSGHGHYCPCVNACGIVDKLQRCLAHCHLPRRRSNCSTMHLDKEIFFLISQQKHILWVLIGRASEALLMSTQMFLWKNQKKKQQQKTTTLPVEESDFLEMCDILSYWTRQNSTSIRLLSFCIFISELLLL